MARVVTFYRFVPLSDPADFAAWLRRRCAHRRIKGTVLAAPEGLNGSLWASESTLAALLAEIAAKLRIDTLNATYSSAGAQSPFRRLKIRLRSQIVSFPVGGLDPGSRTGAHVESAEWNSLLEDPEVLVVDVRNRYEVDIGRFEGALDPSLDRFAEFPSYAGRALDSGTERPIAMYCTGGIRCEKASAYLMDRGFRRVYQLHGGILRYLADTPRDQSRWTGECFVFDHRVSLSPALEPGGYALCHGCRRPLSKRDRASKRYREGVHCPHCVHALTRTQRMAFEERARQMRLAASQGRTHLGPGTKATRARSEASRA